jgi:hypothetical protein
MADETVQDPPESTGSTVWVWSPTGGTTGVNWDEASPEQKENLTQRLRSGELRKASGKDDTPDAPDEIPETRVARAAVPQPAGSPMAPRQGVDPDKAEAQGVDDNAGPGIQAEHDAVKDMGGVDSLQKVQAQQDARTGARVEELEASGGLRQTARGRSAKSAGKP